MTYSCLVWVTTSAFEQVLRRKQSMYKDLLKWLVKERDVREVLLSLGGFTKSAILAQSVSLFLKHKF